MKVKELSKRLRCFNPEDDIVISVRRKGGVTGDMCVDVHNIWAGFDHYNGKVLLVPNELLDVRDPESLCVDESKKGRS